MIIGSQENNDHEGGGGSESLVHKHMWETDYFIGDVTPLIFENFKSKIRAQPPEYIFLSSRIFPFYIDMHMDHKKEKCTCIASYLRSCMTVDVGAEFQCLWEC